jgi:hypothetical protein
LNLHSLSASELLEYRRKPQCTNPYVIKTSGPYTILLPRLQALQIGDDIERLSILGRSTLLGRGVQKHQVKLKKASYIPYIYQV